MSDSIDIVRCRMLSLKPKTAFVKSSIPKYFVRTDNQWFYCGLDIREWTSCWQLPNFLPLVHHLDVTASQVTK
jgi:hypothetical protein